MEEHTVDLVLEAGFWAGITLYPESKCTPARAIDMFETSRAAAPLDELRLRLGAQRSAGRAEDAWKCAGAGTAEAEIDRLVFDNPVRFLRQSPHFQIPV